jgi:hypothetical protein
MDYSSSLLLETRGYSPMGRIFRKMWPDLDFDESPRHQQRLLMTSKGDHILDRTFLSSFFLFLTTSLNKVLLLGFSVWLKSPDCHYISISR